ncbi:MAG: peptide MFS transporter [Pseudomonadota bacterium]|nr:peptide MFS transporter [Pseudomonadota bacterium]
MSGHYPRGLGILFFTEMWERFSFYGMRSLLVLFMTQEFGFSDSRAYGLFGAYVALVYATPVIGGIIADRLLGFKKAILLGGVLIMLGHFCLALPGKSLFYYGLGFIICGTGFLKSCISSTVGELYLNNDAGRDSGFTLFYMGINIGALAASILVGIVASEWGWHYGFGFAGVGMLIGLVTFIVGLPTLAEVGKPPDQEKLPRALIPGISIETLMWLGAFAAVPAISWIVQQTELVGFILGGVTVASAFFIVQLAIKSDRLQRNRLIALLILMLFSVGFFALFEQAGSSMTLFTERSVDREFFGWLIPTPVFQALNPLFIIALAPFFSLFWLQRAAVGREHSTPTKFFLGLLFVALGFGALSFGAMTTLSVFKSSMVWLILAYFLQTVGELCLSPVGLAAVTRLAPQRDEGMLMGLWFLAAAFSNYLAAMIAKLTSLTPDIGNVSEHYSSVFGQVFWAGLLISLIALLCIPVLKRLIGNTKIM